MGGSPAWLVMALLREPLEGGNEDIADRKMKGKLCIELILDEG